MGVNNPRQLMQILQDLTDEIKRFTITVNDTFKQANYSQNIANERINQGLHSAGIMGNLVEEDQAKIQEIKAEITELLTKCYQAVEDAHQTLTQVTNAYNVAQETLAHWQRELELALSWLHRAEIRLDKAIQEYNEAKRDVESAKYELQSAQSSLNSCLSYRDSEGRGKDCSREYTRVAQAEANLQRAFIRLQEAEIELQEAQEEVERAKARVNCCRRAVAYAQDAVIHSQNALLNANDGVNFAERSLEEIKTTENFLIKTEDIIISAQENAENMMIQVKEAQRLTDEAQNYFQKVGNLSEVTYSYATLGSREIEDKINSLILLNRPEAMFSVPGGNTVYSQSLPNSNTLAGGGSINPNQINQTNTYQPKISEFANSLNYDHFSYGGGLNLNESNQISVLDSQGNKLDCFINFIMAEPGRVKIQDTNVNPSYRNQGIGYKLVESLENKVAKGTILYFEENQAKEFWEKMGFSKKEGSNCYEKIV
jgi:exonuclease VII small subunit